MTRLNIEVSVFDPPIILLMATLPDRDQLLSRAIKSVTLQARKPDAAVIVSDGGSVGSSILKELEAYSIPTHIERNLFPMGAANAWNKGIKYIADRWPQCYIAILDDDDLWDYNHLSTCMESALLHNRPDIIISGLRLIKDDVEQYRSPLQSIKTQDFLIGNPGWQGSNTFIRLSTLQRAGGFTPNLKSCNDRDLAIRVLEIPDLRIAYTHRHTATWHLETQRSALSAYKCPSKLDGLAHFYYLHSFRMTEHIQHLFFRRAYNLFGWDSKDITQRSKEIAYAQPRSKSN